MDNERKQQFLDLIDNDIREFGFHVTYVLEEKDFTPFGYSTGLYKNFGIPEVFVSGLPNGLTNTLITNYAKIFKENQLTYNQKVDTLIDRFLVYLIPVESISLKEKVLASARLYDGYDFESVQIIYPDLNGCFPEDKNYDYDMEIFGSIKNE
ncbi:protein of unknown function [Maribacter dokdonensis]|uniref:DUF4262 domain-containing protein n=1 Tax=Maribacter dokdonensis TaxID=320912 RepID=A0A1H4QVJ6_9FLAO|nr:DUF4262 domain-containing protein [Maribacter dokdonensis]SEC23531.1 protein of unknown function [Maribacter dokdonensis]